MIPVESSNIQEIGYNESFQTLRVAFKNSSLYEYANVPIVVYQAFMVSDSKGRYLNSQIKNKYPCTKVA
jgi:hypothetical protein